MTGKLIIYFDYELQRGVDTTTLKNRIPGIEDYKQTEFILDFLKERDIKVCFSVVGLAAEEGELPYHASEQIKQMAKNSHQVGSHTYFHQRISQLSKESFQEEILRSKRVIEKVTGKKCTDFTPPWDKPQYFGKLGIDIANNLRSIRFSSLNLTEICTVLQNNGYQTYRVCPLMSRFTKLKLSKPFQHKSITCIPIRLNEGFGEKAKKLVQKAIKKNGLATVYGHPFSLSGDPKNKQNFVDFFDYIRKERDAQRLEIITPEEL